MDISVDLDAPAIALSICAHPDDTEFGAGATLAKWAAQGTRICHVVCTDGSKGTWDPNADITQLISTRANEQAAAQRILGGTGSDVWFLGAVDGELENSAVLRRELVALVRTIRPDVIFGHDPWKRYRLHPDHRAAGFLTIDAIVAARDTFFFPELGLTPHRAHTLLLFEADEADHFEDVAESLPTKVAALLAHTSQLRSTMFIDDPTAPAEAQRFADETRRHAADAALDARRRAADAARKGITPHPGVAAIELAEAFKRMRVD